MRPRYQPVSQVADPFNFMNLDDLVKSQKPGFSVIPAKAGIPYS
jgi:hypothetical protein